MKTKIIKIDANNPDISKIKVTARIIRKGGLVAFPTETVYGLGANALNAKAVLKIFKAKNRPQDNPLIVHIDDRKEIYRLAESVSKKVEKLINKFWPGPLTLLLKKSKIVPYAVTGGLDTVAIRMPAHPTALALMKAAETPVAAPSANLAGRPSPTAAEHVLEDLSGRIDAVIDGGKTRVGVESTILDMTGKYPTILRPGGVTAEELRKVLGVVRVHKLAKAEMKIENAVTLAPGMKYRHYAPKTKMILFEGKKKEIVKKIREFIEKHQDRKIGVLTITGSEYKAEIVKFLGKDLNSVAKHLFSALRELDNQNLDLIISEGCTTRGIGLAIMNRLRKASEYNIMKL
ncbi:MAG: threonylcarbamoyl-AMP synthase [Candidatus Thermoplasmatota archaeon]|nr:threonylcarbamoyl-AMP synthase [Candidatus Thermoplasmatota archaeon]